MTDTGVVRKLKNMYIYIYQFGTRLKKARPVQMYISINHDSYQKLKITAKSTMSKLQRTQTKFKKVGYQGPINEGWECKTDIKRHTYKNM